MKIKIFIHEGYTAYHLSIQYRGDEHHIELFLNESGVIDVGGRRYSIRSDDPQLLDLVLPRIQSQSDIDAVVKALSPIGRVQILKLGRENITPRLDAYCNAFELAGFMGDIWVEQEGEVLLDRSYGASTEDEQQKLYYIASVSKQFTAAGIMQLVEEGRIDLRKSINAYLPPEFQSDK